MQYGRERRYDGARGGYDRNRGGRDSNRGFYQQRETQEFDRKQSYNSYAPKRETKSQIKQSTLSNI